MYPTELFIVGGLMVMLMAEVGFIYIVGCM